MESEGSRVREVNRDHRGKLVRPDLLAYLDHVESQARLDHPDNEESQVRIFKEILNDTAPNQNLT